KRIERIVNFLSWNQQNHKMRSDQSVRIHMLHRRHSASSLTNSLRSVVRLRRAESFLTYRW
ncbi:hypothetical protein EF574_25080, partial [Salmonella enterica subsp. enterica serovar Heidelberg]|nr:hypothetical protein [Salmonella enterica subsp. enterica serovar Heidelberg]